jgi:DNA-binding protein H-NS
MLKQNMSKVSLIPQKAARKNEHNLSWEVDNSTKKQKWCEEQKTDDISNCSSVRATTDKTIEFDQLNPILSSLTYSQIGDLLSQLDESKLDSTSEEQENIARVEEEYSKIEEMSEKATPTLKKGVSMFERPPNSKEEDMKLNATPEPLNGYTSLIRSRKMNKK